MNQACVRCHGGATTLLTYHHANAEAFLDATLGHERSYHGILLCDRHADGFRAPQGWQLFDRRARVWDDRSVV